MSQLQTVLGGGICLLAAARLGIDAAGLWRKRHFERQQSRSRVARFADELAALGTDLATPGGDTVAWEGWRRFRIDRKVVESLDCVSLYLVPDDGGPLPTYLPGQFLTFSVTLPGDTTPTIRCYSLSDAPASDHYRCTIRKVAAPPDRPDLPPGRVSSFLVDRLQSGDRLDVKPPQGAFYLKPRRTRPVVLIAGGIGVTPMLSMLNTLVDHDFPHEIYFFYGVRNSRHHCFRQALERTAGWHKNVDLHVCYSRPLPADTLNVDYQHAGHVSLALLRETLPSSNFDYFVCGPPAFMRSVLEALQAWGVPDDDVYTETFGPACVNPRRKSPPTTPCDIEFSRSGKTVSWAGQFQTLLELAESQDVPIATGCRTGNCGACVTAIASGTVAYLERPAAKIDAGTCLPCICAPASDLVLDA